MKLAFAGEGAEPDIRAGAQFADWDRPAVNGNSIGVFVWVAGDWTKSHAREIVLEHDGQCIARLSPLWDTAEVLESLCPAQARDARFAHLCINRLLLPAEGILAVLAVDAQGKRRAAGRIEFGGNDTSACVAKADLGLAPILIDSLGRSGSTVLAHCLGAHPAIATFGGYPYEYRFFSYCLHAAYVATSPANHAHSMGGDAFENRHPFELGFNPFNHRDYDRALGHDGLRSFYESGHAASVVGFFAGEARKAIALQSRDKPGAVAFVEKVGGPLLADLAANVCVGVREIVLVREFWDLALSMIAFDAKRGTSGFFHAASRAEADAWLVDLAARLGHLRRRADKPGMIALSYEELMRDPRACVRSLMDALAIETDAAALDAMVKAIAPTANTGAHSTTEEKRAIRRDDLFSSTAMAEADRALAA